MASFSPFLNMKLLLVMYIFCFGTITDAKRIDDPLKTLALSPVRDDQVVNDEKYNDESQQDELSWILPSFSTSQCLNGSPQLNLELRCPLHHQIKTRTAFAATSRNGNCYFRKNDCIMQPIRVLGCNGKTSCIITKTVVGLLNYAKCDRDNNVYILVDYECVTSTAARLRETWVDTTVSWQTVFNQTYDNVTSEANKTEGDTILPAGKFSVNDDSIIVKDNNYGQGSRPLTSTFIFSGVVAGTVVGLLLIAVTIVIVIRRSINKPYQGPLFPSFLDSWPTSSPMDVDANGNHDPWRLAGPSLHCPINTRETTSARVLQRPLSSFM